MAKYSVYRTRLMQDGMTERDRWANRVKNRIETGMQNNPSYHDVSIRDKTVGVCINSTDTASIKKFFTPHTTEVYIGDYIIWNGMHWIVTERDLDDGVYIRGKITACNYQLAWQAQNGTVVRRWCVVNMISKYNNGVFEGKILDNIESTITVIMRADEETLKLRLGRRLMADVITDVPFVYKISQRDVLTSRYGEYGLMTLALSQDVFNDTTDNVELMVADYIAHPCQHDWPADLRIGKQYTLTSESAAPAWKILEGEVCVQSEVGNNTIRIIVPTNNSLIGTEVVITDGTYTHHAKIRGMF